uniref:Immunoglobulin domain-containing protein n=1 Tax=Myripristis murdjan TaxID=586833 RepID=A0A667XBZ2_9TELE
NIFLFNFIFPYFYSVAEVIQRRVGQNVTLQTGVTGLQADDDITCSVLSDDSNKKLKLDYIDRFKGRLHLQEDSGSLTITNLNMNDTAFYQVQIINGKSSTHTFSLIVKWPFGYFIMCVLYLMHLTQTLFCVFAVTAVLAHGEAEVIRRRVGQSVTLQTGVTGLQADDDITCSILSDDSDKLRLHQDSGSLTIMNLNMNDTAVYQIQIINGNSSTHTFNITVGDTTPPLKVTTPPLKSTTPPHNTGLTVGLAVGIPVALLVAAVIVGLYCAGKCGGIGRKY